MAAIHPPIEADSVALAALAAEAVARASADLSRVSFSDHGLLDVTKGPYNADPSGVDDSTAAFQAALDDGSIAIPAGTYRVGQVTHEGASRRIVALGPVTIVQTDVDGVFSLRGGWELLGTVNSIATVTNADLVTSGESNPSTSRSTVSQLTLASSATVAVGDVLKVVSDDLNPWGRVNSAAAEPRMGEYSLAGLASTGTTVTLTNVLVESYATAVRVARLNDVSFRVEGPITFDTDPAIRNTAAYGAVIELRAARDCYVGGGVRFRNSVGRAIGNYTYNATFDGITFRNLANRPSLSHYGYGVQDGGWQTKMRGCHGENLRHLYSEGSNTVSAGSANYEYHGGGWYALVSNCTAQNCAAQPFDTHGTAYAVTFANCKVVGTFGGASTGAPGYASRGRFITFRDCEVDGGTRGFTVAGHRTRLINCTATRCRYSALEIVADMDDSSHQTTQGGHEIRGGLFETVGANRVLHMGSSGYTVDAYVENATFRPVLPATGTPTLNPQFTSTLRGRSLRVDYSGVTAAVATQVLAAGADTVTVRIVGLDVHALGSAVTASTILAQSSGVAADMEVEDIRWEHASVSPAPKTSALTNTRYSLRAKYGTSWFHYLTSDTPDFTAVASGVLPIADKLDREITVRLSGSAGALSLAAIPTTARVNGQRLNIFNGSNGVVTVNSVAIAVNAVAAFVYVGNVWRQIV